MIRFPKPAKRSAAERKAARAKKRAAAKRAQPMSRPKLEKLADDVHSVYIRAQRYGCEMSGYPHAAKRCPGRGQHPSELQCAHGWDRGAKAVRFDPSNTYALCPRCHTKYTRNHRQGDAQWHDWMAMRLGEQVYQELRERARPLRQWAAWELVEIIEERLRWIADLPDTLRKEWAQERLGTLARQIQRARTSA